VALSRPPYGHGIGPLALHAAVKIWYYSSAHYLDIHFTTHSPPDGSATYLTLNLISKIIHIVEAKNTLPEPGWREFRVPFQGVEGCA